MYEFIFRSLSRFCLLVLQETYVDLTTRYLDILLLTIEINTTDAANDRLEVLFTIFCNIVVLIRTSYMMNLDLYFLYCPCKMIRCQFRTKHAKLV
jgi:hypothetical protein